MRNGHSDSTVELKNLIGLCVCVCVCMPVRSHYVIRKCSVVSFIIVNFISFLLKVQCSAYHSNHYVRQDFLF